VVTALCVLINYMAPESAFGLLMALVVSALVINWAMISLAHMKFRKAKQQQGVTPRFPALLYPLGNWICLLFMAAVLVIMLMTDGMAISVYLIPVWLVVLASAICLKRKAQNGESALILPALSRPGEGVIQLLSNSHFPLCSCFVHIPANIL
jgi:aromatic amino acid transport protein AroP